MILLTLFALSLTKPTICLDPGHVSDQSPGTRGRRWTEVHANWVIAKAVEARLEAEGYHVVLTKRTERQVVTNRRRAEIANNSHASLLVRLHCDANSGTGFAVYVPTREGRAPDGHRGPSQAVLASSQKAGQRFHAAFSSALAGHLKDNGLKSDLATAIGRRQGALTGSVYSKVPVLLVEMVVLTNRRDEEFVMSPHGQDALAKAFVKAIEAAVPKRG